MKKVIALLLSLSLLVSFGCASRSRYTVTTSSTRKAPKVCYAEDRITEVPCQTEDKVVEVKQDLTWLWVLLGVSTVASLVIYGVTAASIDNNFR